LTGGTEVQGIRAGKVWRIVDKNYAHIATKNWRVSMTDARLFHAFILYMPTDLLKFQ